MSSQVGVLARIGIDADALLDHPGQDRPSMNVHRLLTLAVAEVGIVETLGTADASALLSSVESLNDDMRALWVRTIVNLDRDGRFRVGSRSRTTGDALLDPNSIPDALRDTVDLVVVSETAAERHGVPKTDGYLAGEPELAAADSVPLCNTITEVRNLRSKGNYRRETRREDVEEAVFKPLAALSTHVTLLDRYFLAHALQPRGEQERDHLPWLIRTLDTSMRPGSTLRILSELPKDEELQRARRELRKARKADAASDEIKRLQEDVERREAQQREEIEAALRGQVAPLLCEGRLMSVEVVLARWPWESGKRPHNRHARFNCSIAVSCDEGFDHLDAEELHYLEGFSWKAVTDRELFDDLADRELKVLNAGPRVRFTIGRWDLRGSSSTPR